MAGKPPSTFGRRKQTPFGLTYKTNLKRSVVNPALEFALQNDMITKDEYDACLTSDMSLINGILYNWNYKHPTIPTGTSYRCDVGRATKIMVGRLLGYDE